MTTVDFRRFYPIIVLLSMEPVGGPSEHTQALNGQEAAQDRRWTPNPTYPLEDLRFQTLAEQPATT